MIHFVTWKWRQKINPDSYTANYVNAMVHMLAAKMADPYRVICVTDRPEGVICKTYPIWDDWSALSNISGQHLPSCYRRLKIFDRATQQSLGIKEGDPIVSIDIDAVLVREITPLFRRKERFVGWHVPGSRHPIVYNGSMFMFTAGDLDFMWHEFNGIKSQSPMKTLVAGYMGSDQGWISYRLIKESYAAGWTAEKDGVLSFTRNVQRNRMQMHNKIDPMKGRIVFFAGRRKPWHLDVLQEHPWINNYVSVPKELVA